MNNKGPLLAFILCCGWPLIVYAVLTYGKSIITQRDWSHIRWDDIKFPWSKDK